MKNYEKPSIHVCPVRSEGVYTASGMSTSNSSDGSVKCDSQYMKGIWQAIDNSSWWNNGVETKRGYKDQFGCNGCPANTGSGCGLLNHYVDSNYASSYEVDNGKRMPTWESKGYGPNDIVSDWNC